MMEWLKEKLVHIGEIKSIREKKDILLDIQIKLKSLNNEESQQIFRPTFDRLFALLNSQDWWECLKDLCHTLQILFSVLKPEEVYPKYSTEIQLLLNHQDYDVRAVALEEISTIACNPETVHLLFTDESLLVAIVNNIEHNRVDVVFSAMFIIRNIGKNSKGLEILYKGELLKSFAKLLVKDDTVSFRVYEIVVDVAKFSKEGLEASVQTGFLNSLIKILDNDDVLLQVNALEMLTELASTEEGLRFLEQQGVLMNLSRKINENIHNEDPLFSLFVPGLMKFFGNVAYYWPHEIFSQYPNVVSTLFFVIEHPENASVLYTALDTLGHVSRKVESKYALQALGDAMPRAMRIIGSSMKGSTSQLTICCLNNLALIIDVPKDEQDDKIMLITKSWFNCLGDDPVGAIASLCEYPFADIRQPALEVLVVLASQPWGKEYLSNHHLFPSTDILFRDDPNIKCKEIIRNLKTLFTAVE